MKMQSENRAVTLEGLTDENEVRDFSIKADAAMFKMLSSTLYTHKIRAVIREVTCNAWDAHVSANRRTTPIEVHLPTVMEPYFEVKDFGKGLNQENVMYLFSTYGGSTKQKSNKEIGGFGIGSKSPFCYVDSFLVESRFEGEKYTYNAFIKKDGAPSIVLLGKHPMEDGELSGITIRLNCNSKDIAQFEQDAKIVLRQFENPSVKVNTDLKPLQFIHEDEFGKVLDSKEYDIRGLFARMGNVTYPIPREVYQYVEYKKGKQLPYAFHSNGYLFDFKIGELEIAPSREQLSLTDETKKAIIERLKAFVNHAVETEAARLNKHKNIYDYINDRESIDQYLAIEIPKFKNGGVNPKKLSPQQRRTKPIPSKYGQPYSGNRTGETRKELNYGSGYACGIIFNRLRSISNNNRWPSSLSWELQARRCEERPTSKIQAIMQKINRKDYKYTYMDKINVIHHPENASNIDRDTLNQKQLPIILVLHGNKEAIDSSTMRYKYYLRKKAKEGQIVYCVKVPHLDAPYLRALRRKCLWIPETQFIRFCDLPQPTEQELKDIGLVKEDAKVVNTITAARKYNVHVLRERDGNFYTGTETMIESPTDLPKYKDLKDGEKIYYVQWEEWHDKYSNQNKITEPQIVARRMLARYWDKLPNRPTIYGFCKTHIDMVEGNDKFVEATDLFRGYLVELIKKMEHDPEWIEKMQRSIEGVGTGGYISLRQMTNGADPLVIKNPKLERYATLIDHIQGRGHDGQRLFYDRSALKGLRDYAVLLNVEVAQKELDRIEKKCHDDGAFLTEFYLKYPVFTIESAFDKKAMVVLEEYMETIDKLTAKKIKVKGKLSND